MLSNVKVYVQSSTDIFLLQIKLGSVASFLNSFCDTGHSLGAPNVNSTHRLNNVIFNDTGPFWPSRF